MCFTQDCENVFCFEDIDVLAEDDGGAGVESTVSVTEEEDETTKVGDELGEAGDACWAGFISGLVREA